MNNKDKRIAELEALIRSAPEAGSDMSVGDVERFLNDWLEWFEKTRSKLGKTNGR